MTPRPAELTRAAEYVASVSPDIPWQVIALVLPLVLALQAGAASIPGRSGARSPGLPHFDRATFDPLVEGGIERGAYPGAALVIGRHDAVLFAKGYGHLTWSGSNPGVDPDSTIYDLASLTKV